MASKRLKQKSTDVDLDMKYVNDKKRWFDAALTCASCYRLQEGKSEDAKAIVKAQKQATLISLLSEDIERSLIPAEVGDVMSAKLLRRCINGRCNEAKQLRRDLAEQYIRIAGVLSRAYAMKSDASMEKIYKDADSKGGISQGYLPKNRKLLDVYDENMKTISRWLKIL